MCVVWVLVGFRFFGFWIGGWGGFDKSVIMWKQNFLKTQLIPDGLLKMVRLEGLPSLGSLGVLELLQSFFLMWWLSTSFTLQLEVAYHPRISGLPDLFWGELLGHCCCRHLQGLAWSLLMSCNWAGLEKSWNMCELIFSVVVLFHVNTKLSNTETMMVSINHLCNNSPKELFFNNVLPCYIPHKWAVWVSLNGGREKKKGNDFLITDMETAVMPIWSSADEIATSVLSHLQIPLSSFYAKL